MDDKFLKLRRHIQVLQKELAKMQKEAKLKSFESLENHDEYKYMMNEIISDVLTNVDNLLRVILVLNP